MNKLCTAAWDYFVARVDPVTGAVTRLSRPYPILEAAEAAAPQFAEVDHLHVIGTRRVEVSHD